MTPNKSVSEGLKIQHDDLCRWRMKLNAECYCALSTWLEGQNALLTDHHNLYDVKRGDDLTYFILNWKSQRD